MRNVWLIAVREFRERVRSRGFLISSIAVPLMIILIWAVTGVFSLGGETPPDGNLPETSQDLFLGFVDEAGLIDSIPAPLDQDLIQPFENIELANQALETGEIDAYYWVPPDYIETGEIRRVSLDLPNGPVENDFFNFILTNNLLANEDQHSIERLRDPFGATGLQFTSVVDSKDAGANGFSFTPFMLTFVVIMPLFISGGYLLQSLAQEKSSRVMEILLVSLRPRQLLAGKLIGLGALTLVQYLFWILVVGIALLLTRQDLTRLAAGVNISLQEVVWIILFALGGYSLYAAFMAGLGALAPNLEGSRSWTMLISSPMMIPIYLWFAIVQNPHGILAVALSLIPLTSPVAMLMRMTSASVPPLQVLLSLAILFLTGIGVTGLMARLFRVRTLLSGEDVSLRRFWSVVTEP